MWDHSNPVYIDFETQSACDLKEAGGRGYAGHPSTRVLILVACIDDVYHVWIPDHIRVDTSTWNHSRLWPHQITPAKEVRLYRGKIQDFRTVYCPAIEANRPFIAHNAYGFDRQIWHCMDASRPRWLDSLIIAKASGRSGKLDTLGQSILGQGKDRAKKLLPILTKAGYSHALQSYTYPLIKPGDLQAFTTYAIADVAILKMLWEGEFSNIAVEEDVVRVHDEINIRGVKVDRELLDTIESLSKYSVDHSINEIEELTDGAINANNIRSIKQMHEWLDGYGVSIVDENGKPCLRKEVVKRYIDSPYLIESSNLSAAKEIPPLVVKVLELRLKALRITTAKVERAKQRVRPDGRIRDLHSYHQAHPGRWSSIGVQIHNLPRPIKGVDTELILRRLSETKDTIGTNDIRIVYERIRDTIPAESRKNVTVDDICSTLIRPIFVPKKDHKFVICDLSQIEARALAWIADERKLLSTFKLDPKKGGDIYKKFGSRLYGCSEEDITGIKRDASKVIVLACGYGMGPDKLRVYCANAGIDLIKAGLTAEHAIATYRDTYTNICGFKPDPQSNFRCNGIWHKLDSAVKDAVTTRQPQFAGKCEWFMQGKDLLCRLPSGRINYYNNARMEDIVPGYCYTLGLPLIPKATVVYEGAYGIKSLYGGLITENVCQAICRDLLARALVYTNDEGYKPVLHVHDEIVCEVEDSKVDEALERIVEIMSTCPEWAEGFPVACEGFISPRFVKKAFKGYRELDTYSLIESKVEHANKGECNGLYSDGKKDSTQEIPMLL
jgi:DNA polymerase